LALIRTLGLFARTAMVLVSETTVTLSPLFHSSLSAVMFVAAVAAFPVKTGILSSTTAQPWAVFHCKNTTGGVVVFS